ncbi:MAG: hypothetical protein HDT43_01070 [Ruminococcaceae bacterium]|nr:hypothetical protein [Oscillospiraceae bacterium]
MMRVLFCELRKIFSSGIFIFIVSAAVILNLYLCFTADPVEVSDEQYRAFFDELDGISDAEKTAAISAKIDELYNGEYTFDMVNRLYFLRGELEQAELIADYKNYLSEIDASAERMTSVSIFAKKDSFAYKNITRTPAAYNAVRGVAPAYSRSEGIRLAIDDPSCDIMLIFCALTAVVVLIVKERESGITALIKPLRHGRAHLASAKSAAVLLCIIVTGILLYGSALAVGAARFGLGDLSLPVQSLSGFIGCNLPINIGTAMALIFIVKIAAAFLAALIFECLCTALYSIYAYIAAAVITAAEVIMFVIIDGNSWAAVFGKINLAAFSQSAGVFKNYLNINIFGEPCNIIFVTIISLAVGIIGFFILQNFLFSRIAIKDFKTRRIIPSIRYIPKKPFSYAVYKQFATHNGALIILLILGVQIYLAANYRIEFNTDDMRYRAYCVQFSQMTEQQADEFAETEKRRFEELHERILTADLAEMQEIHDELSAEDGFKRAYEQQRYISALDSNNKAMFYQTGWRRLFGADGYAEDMQLTLFAALGICFGISPLIAYDNRRRLGYLLYTNPHGKRGYFRRNTAVSAIASALISIAVNVPRITGILSLYKTDGAEFSIRCIPEFERFFDIPIAAYIALLCVLRTLSLILCGWVILFISSKCNNVSAALLISMAVFALPVMLYLAGAEFVLPVCMPFSVDREIIDDAWGYTAVLILTDIALGVLRRKDNVK